jgi:diguanylate cyclase (GGDEF)-like protein
MLTNHTLDFLLASPEPALLSALEPVLSGDGMHVEVVLSGHAAVKWMTAPVPPGMVLLDTRLPGIPTGQLLAAVRTEETGRRFPIVLVSDTVTEEWTDRMKEGVIDDLILRNAEPAYWKLRMDMVLRAFRMSHEVDTLRETMMLNAQLDRLTGVYNREALLSILFRETDRVQRLKSSMCVVLFDIDDFGHWNSRLGADACDELLCQVVSRTTHLLRSYDVLGRPGMDEFLIALPGCGTGNAAMMAERLRVEVFGEPFRIGGDTIRLSACFGIASSLGRSPVVVLREAEEALARAALAGPETILCFGEAMMPTVAPVTYISPGNGGELLAW